MFLLDAFNDNKYSFLGARFTAMDEMINNSQEYLDRLTIKYNKLRQESITTEIVEIIACKEAIVEE
jgi:F-type H+-transporting ATPase subunit gamma